MGDPRRLRKKYTTPSNAFQRARMLEELKYIGRYGLRNKKEFWKHRTQLSRFRDQARAARASVEGIQAQRLNEMRSHLSHIGLCSKDAQLDDILGITVDQILNRRLQTVVFRKGLARTIYQARQIITHGHIALGGLVVDSPSYLVPIADENAIGYANNSAFYNANQKVWGEQSPNSNADIMFKENDAQKREAKAARGRDGRKGGNRGGRRYDRSSGSAGPSSSASPSGAAEKPVAVESGEKAEKKEE